MNRIIAVLCLIGLCGIVSAQEEDRFNANIGDSIELTGLLEAEAYSAYYRTRRDSDVILDRAEVNLRIIINESLSINTMFLFEEDVVDPMELEEAYFSYEFQNMRLRGGRKILPFGSFETFMIVDPLTRELGQITESAVLFMYDFGMGQVEGGFFNGDIGIDQPSVDEIINNVFLSATFKPPVEGLEIGAAYITNIADTNRMEYQWLFLPVPEVQDAVPAVAVWGRYKFGRFNFLLEYIMASTEFDDLDLDIDGDGNGDQPSAINAEASYMYSEQITFAVRYGISDEFLDYPLSILSAGVRYYLTKEVSLAAELGYFDHDGDLAAPLARDDGQGATVQFRATF
ncbi:LbtU family siderophore porin [Planctomycetota bacterium]